MPTVKVLKDLVRTVPDIRDAINSYMLTGSMSIAPNDTDWTILDCFGVDNSIIAMYSNFASSQCAIEGIGGVIEVDRSKLDEVWETIEIEEVSVDKYVRDVFAYKIKDDKALLELKKVVGLSLTPQQSEIYNKCKELFANPIYADGSVTVTEEELDQVWEEITNIDGNTTQVLVRDRFEHEGNLLNIGFALSYIFTSVDDPFFRKVVDKFKTADFSNFYCTTETAKRKREGFTLDKSYILDMLKADLENWMIKRGLDKLMPNFDEALKSELQNFVISYYYL